MKSMSFVRGALPFFSLVLACGGESPTENSADEVRTIDCPVSVALELDKPILVEKTPTKFDSGKAISAAADQKRIALALETAGSFEGPSFDLILTTKANSKCNYVSANSHSPTAPTAVLGGTSAKPVFDVTFGDYHYVSRPAYFSKAGLAFEKNAKADVLLKLSTTAASNVTIGTAAVSDVAMTPEADAIASAVTKLEALIDRQGVGTGTHDVEKAYGKKPIDAVKAYIVAKYGENLEESISYREEAEKLVVGDDFAGTLTAQAAVDESLANISAWLPEVEFGTPVAKRLDEVKTLLSKMEDAGATFGFDGLATSHCQQPTAFLLVISSDAKVVHGIDLSPCQD